MKLKAQYLNGLLAVSGWGVALLVIILLPQSGFCQPSDYSKAQTLATSGKHKAASELYEIILARDPNNTEYILGSAFNYSWGGNHDLAAEAFTKILAKDPQNISALSGMGYNLAWSGEYVQAKVPFEQIRKMDLNSEEARKGLAYVYLWQGSGEVSARYFQKLLKEFPEKSEYAVGLGMALESANQNRKARQALKQALIIDPQNQSATTLIKQLNYKAAFLEADILAGVTYLGTETKSGIRLLQLAVQANKKFRIYAKYDNSLSIENRYFILNGQSAPAGFLGTRISWNERFTSTFETGIRSLPDAKNQFMIQGEQVIKISSHLLAKAGGTVALSSNSEWMIFSGLTIPIGSYFFVEPVYYHTRPANSSRTENRILLSAKLRSPKGYELTVGGITGRVNIEAEAVRNRIYSTYLTGIVPFNRTIWGMLNLQREWGVFDSFTAVNFGLKLRLEK